MSETTHHEAVDVTDPQRRPHVLMVVANPGVSTTLGWPVGFWAAELFHPYLEFSQRRYDVTIASPEGGKVVVDALSDPRDPSRWSADDLISLGALNSADVLAALEDTPALRDLDLDAFDAIVVCGGQGPMFQFRDHGDLQRAVGQRTMPLRIEDEARARGANYIQGGLLKAFAVRDMNLITGQQQYSGRKVAELVIDSLGG